MNRLLRLALALAPVDFRERFGDEIRYLLEVRASEVRARNGLVGLWRFWAFHVVDLMRTVIAERRSQQYRRDNRMKKRRPGMASFIRDLGHAARTFRRDRAFAAIAVVTLALGIGANATVFSVVNGVLLRPLPYPDPEQLVTVWSELPGFGFDRFGAVTDAQYLHYKERTRTLQALAGLRQSPARLTGETTPELIDGVEATVNFFSTLGVAPAIGRSFVAAEMEPGGPAVAILSHELWTRSFAGDPGILGRTVNLDDHPTEIIGIMPAGFRYGQPEAKVFRPLRINRDSLVGTSFSVRAIGRLASGVTREEAAAEFVDLVASLPETDPGGFFTAATIEQGQLKPDINLMVDDVVGSIRTALWILLGTVGLVMLIACANVANLFLVRAEGRQKEVAVRVALGANRSGIARLFLTESVLLGLAAGLVGLGVAYAGTRGLVAFGDGQLPRLDDIRLDGTVVLFTLGVSILSGFLFGAFPALRHSRPDLGTTLQQEGRSGTTSRERQRIRAALVVTQVALALVLLIGSGLMVRSLVSLGRVDPGFTTSGILTFNVALPPESYHENASVVGFYQQLVERLAALPGVEAAGAGSRLPLYVGSGTTVIPEGFEVDPDGLPPIVYDGLVTPGFFRSVGIPVLSGRTFETADQTEDATTAIVSRGFVERFWPGENGVGMRFRTGTADEDESENPWLTVVGVVGDVRGNGLREDPVTQVYFPSFGIDRSLVVVVRTAGDASLLAPSVRSEVWALDPNLPVTDVETIEAILADSMASTVFTMVLLAVAAGLALVLGTVGIYGVIAYVVSLRTREIGVRMALGARQWDVSRMVLRQGGLVVAGGVAIGLAAAVGLTRLMESLLFGVTAFDPLTFGTGAVVIALVSLLASYLPARRAARVDPLVALRAE